MEPNAMIESKHMMGFQETYRECSWMEDRRSKPLSRQLPHLSRPVIRRLFLKVTWDAHKHIAVQLSTLNYKYKYKSIVLNQVKWMAE